MGLFVLLPLIVVPVVVSVLAARIVERGRAQIHDFQKGVALGAVDQIPDLDRVAQAHPRAAGWAARAQLALGTPLTFGLIKEEIVIHDHHSTGVTRLRIPHNSHDIARITRSVNRLGEPLRRSQRPSRGDYSPSATISITAAPDSALLPAASYAIAWMVCSPGAPTGQRTLYGHSSLMSNSSSST